MPTNREVLIEAAREALHAPSALNTQPWTWCVRGEVLELYADRDRQLRVADPGGRLLLLSCGIALHHARVSLAAAGFAAQVRSLVESFDDDVLARIELGQPRPVTDDDRAQRDAIFHRRTDRRPFADRRVPDDMLAALAAATESAGARPGADTASTILRSRCSPRPTPRRRSGCWSPSRTRESTNSVPKRC